MTLKLLVADDSVTIQKIVSLAFQGEDVIIKSASSGDAALDMMADFNPDIVLADVFMPGCSGYEICERIRQDPKQAHTPVVLMIGTFDQFNESEASRVKSDGYLRKPFDTSELLQTVRSLVGDKMTAQKDEEVAEPNAGMAQTQDSSAAHSDYSGGEGLVDHRVWESFAGSSQILELFDPMTLEALKTASQLRGFPPAQTGKAIANSEPSATPSDQVSEDFFNLIVDRVVRRMSPDVIREVAWEVVPELSEALIRRTIEEQNKRR